MNRFVSVIVAVITVMLSVGYPAQVHSEPDTKIVVLPPQGFVADYAGVLSPPERDALVAQLRKLNTDKGSQLGVMIVRNTEPETLEDFAQRVFTTWKLGRKGVDDGVLLVVTTENTTRRMRIHVGYGLEGAIPDVIAKRILSETMRPVLDATGPAAAVKVGVAALLERIYAADVKAKSGSSNTSATIEPERPKSPIERLFVGIFLTLVLTLFVFVGAGSARLPYRKRHAAGLACGCAAFAGTVWVLQTL